MSMKDYILIGKNPQTGLYHGYLYTNHPTPSGMDRPILKLSTTEGFHSQNQALARMLSGLTPEYIATIDVPILEEQS